MIMANGEEFIVVKVLFRMKSSSLFYASARFMAMNVSTESFVNDYICDNYMHLSFESELYESSTDHIQSNPKAFVIVIDLNSCPHLFAVC